MKTYYTCVGSVRSDCEIKHRTREAAERCCALDQYYCAKQGGYSDRFVKEVVEEEEE